MELCNCIKNHGKMQRILENRILLLERMGEEGYVRSCPEVDKTLSSWTLNIVNGVHLKIIKNIPGIIWKILAFAKVEK